MLASVGSVGDAYDNALAESFVDSFKTELIADRVWRTRSQLELAVVEYVGWFNDARLHEALGDLPPAEFETLSQTSTFEISLSMNRGNQPNPVSAKPGPAQAPGGSRPRVSQTGEALAHRVSAVTRASNAEPAAAIVDASVARYVSEPIAIGSSGYSGEAGRPIGRGRRADLLWIVRVDQGDRVPGRARTAVGTE